MQNLKLKELSKEDVNDLVKLEKELFKNPYSEELLLRELKTPFSCGIVAKRGEETVGYCLFWIVSGQCEIHRIGVKREFQGKGIGSLLIKAVIDLCKRGGISEVLLEVSEENERALNLYRKFGFFEEGIRKNYYGSENAILMKLKLGGEDAERRKP